MNYARLALAAVSAWALSLAIGYVVNSWVMVDIYQAHAQVFRPEAEMNLPLGFLVQLVAFFAFAYMYAKGYEGTAGVQEGLRFGVLIGLIVIGFATTWSYVTLPVSGTMGIYWTVDVLLEMAIYGAVVGLIYRPRT